MVFMAALSTVWAQTKSLYFLNKPESIATTQRLAQLSVQAGEHVRIFLHYRNAGRKTMQFKLSSNQPILGVVGFAFHESPGIAGSNAALEFFQSALILRNIEIKHKWLPGQTISGIIEFTAVKDMQINCQTGDTINPQTRIGVTSTMEAFWSANIQNTPVKIRFGGDGPQSNRGPYGVKQHITINNTSDKPQNIIVYASPRAGKAVVTWGVNGTYHNTPMIPAKGRYRLATFTLRPSQSLRLTTMPAGGMAYPVELEFVPRTVETVENVNAPSL
jgi:hypothetical protein